MTDDKGASLREAGSPPTGQAPAGLDATRLDPARLDALRGELTELEEDLIMGRCTGWGSWMWDAGSRLASLGLAEKIGTFITFDTPMALAMRSHIYRTDKRQKPDGEDPQGLRAKHDGAVAEGDGPNPKGNDDE